MFNIYPIPVCITIVPGDKLFRIQGDKATVERVYVKCDNGSSWGCLASIIAICYSNEFGYTEAMVHGTCCFCRYQLFSLCMLNV